MYQNSKKILSKGGLVLYVTITGGGGIAKLFEAIYERPLRFVVVSKVKMKNTIGHG